MHPAARVGPVAVVALHFERDAVAVGGFLVKAGLIQGDGDDGGLAGVAGSITLRARHGPNQAVAERLAHDE